LEEWTLSKTLLENIDGLIDMLTVVNKSALEERNSNDDFTRGQASGMDIVTRNMIQLLTEIKQRGGQGQQPNPLKITEPQKIKINALIDEKRGKTKRLEFFKQLQTALNINTPAHKWDKKQASQAITLLENWGKNNK
jgi:hypothetical protein